MTMHIRNITPAPTTVDMEARTVEAIVSTGADTPRPGFIERLELTGADLSQMVGAPVLDAHRSASTRDQLGVIEAVEIRPEGLWARIKFRSNPAAAVVLNDIAEGTLRGLSIGYRVAEWTEKREGKNLIRIAKKWTPIEASIVPVPADRGAHFRNGGQDMPDIETVTPPETQAPPAVENRGDINREIRSMAKAAGLDDAWANDQIDNAATVDQARDSALKAMQTRQSQTRTTTTRVTVGHDNTDPAVIATRAGEALFARSNPGHELSEAARPYANMSFVDLGRDCLQRAGTRTTGMSADTVITRALTTSDFPLILGEASNRTLRQAYESAPSGVRQVARQSTAPDFRDKHALQLGEGPGLKRVSEAGEYKYGTIDEARESYRVETSGRIFGVSRPVLVNDNLGATTRVPAELGRSAASHEAKMLVELVEANSAMSDSKAVFHADHANLAANGSELTEATLSAARLAMRKQTGLSGERINATPKFVLVGPELETQAEKLLAQITATKTADVNAFDNLTLIVEPRLSDPSAWYVVADPAMIDGIEYAYLEGAPGPQIETRQGFERDGVEMKVRLDFGCGWIDWRGWYKNAGA